MPYERFVQTQLFEPLQMRDTFFDTTIDGRHRALLAPQLFAASEQKLRAKFGTVPGLNGHAGMLSTADDVAKLAVALLRAEHGALTSAPLRPQTVRAMLEPHYVGQGNVRAYGWDLDSVYSRNRGEVFPRGGFGHTGSSGTSIWIDPALDLAVVFASNAHYPNDLGTTLALEAKIATIVAAQAELDPDAAEAARTQEARFDAAVARSALEFADSGRRY
jgi:CubicO group peptidase (beta-lactamase class C family)